MMARPEGGTAGPHRRRRHWPHYATPLSGEKWGGVLLTFYARAVAIFRYRVAATLVYYAARRLLIFDASLIKMSGDDGRRLKSWFPYDNVTVCRLFSPVFDGCS